MMPDRDSLSAWVRTYLGQLLRIDSCEIALTRAIGDFGLDSADAVIMAAAIEEQFDIEIEPSIVLEHDTIEDMITALTGGADG